MIKISGIIIAKNEEEKIADCLKSLKWADEIVLIDNESSDNTAEIAKKAGAKVYSFKGGTYADRKNFGAEKAEGDWLLYVDADERVTTLLQREVTSEIQKLKSRISAYAVPRSNIILGKELTHGGWWPDYVKHLVKKSALIKWEGDLHEEPKFTGKLGYLKNPLVHLKHDNLSDMVVKTNSWSGTEARLMLEAGHPPMNVPRFLTAIMREFWLRMIKQKAFLDGTEGVIYAMYQVYSRFISYAKLWEMQLKIK